MRRNLLLVLAAVLIAVAGFVLYRSRSAPRVKPPRQDPAVTWSLDQSIDEAADYLSRVNDAEGRFEYRLFSDGRHGDPKKYNILRHAGSIYALADYATQSANPERRARAGATTARATKYLFARYGRPLKDHADVLGLFSDAKEEGLPRAAVKLGANGLGMIGLMGKMRAAEVEGTMDSGTAESKAQEVATAESLARFVGLAEKPAGDFRGKYEEEKGFVGDSDSLYYPGEAILGLTMVYERDHDKRWLELGIKAIQFLVESRKGVKKIPNDHWLMIAIDRLDPLFGDIPSPPITREAVVQHSIDIGKSMLDDLAHVDAKTEAPDLDGSFNLDGRTAPNATRLEGLLALEHTLAAFPQHAEMRKRVRLAAARGIAFLRRAQVRDGIAKGGMPASVHAVANSDESPEDDKRDAGAEEREVRIDYVQHAMSALMRYRAMCAKEPAGEGCR